MIIKDYQPLFNKAFKQLNMAWIEKFFKVEAMDIQVLENPEEYIIKQGGFIFFALEGELVIGTVALIKQNDDSYELAKMAVSEEHQNKGIGKQLIAACIEKAKQKNIQKIFLESNTILSQAIILYKKFGFIEVPKNNSHYERCNIKMELYLTLLS